MDSVDLVVVGGGITGCAVARDAAARGLSVVLAERRDLAAGTSGRSTKLLHGGLRYLEHGHFRLVREALREREITATLAPALARPLRFVLPTRKGASPGRLAARLGVAIYDALAGRQPLPRGAALAASDLATLAPGLSPGWTGGVAFSDRQTDDARLTVSIARDARSRGADVRLGLTVAAMARSGSGIVVSCRDEEGRESEIAAGCVVNAAGPWSDAVRGLWSGSRRKALGLSRGAHLVLSGLRLTVALLLPGARRRHRIFAIPWRDAVLFGTTDEPDTGDPARDLPEVGDLRLLFDEARRHFSGVGLTRGHVLSAFTGTRPLLSGGSDTLGVSREHRVFSDGPLVTITGGKLTTWRSMGVEAVDAAVRVLGRDAPSPRSLLHEPLPGGDDDRPSLASVLAHEMPRHLDDVVFRRLPIGHDPAGVRRALPEIADTMAASQGWDAARKSREIVRVTERLDAMSARIDEAIGA